MHSNVGRMVGRDINYGILRHLRAYLIQEFFQIKIRAVSGSYHVEGSRWQINVGRKMVARTTFGGKEPGLVSLICAHMK